MKRFLLLFAALCSFPAYAGYTDIPACTPVQNWLFDGSGNALGSNGVGNSLNIQITSLPFVYYQTVESSGTPVLQRTYLNFGSGLTVTDDSAHNSTDIIVPVMTGATSGSNGTAGLAPAPSAGQQGIYFLRGDGTWAIPAGTSLTFNFPLLNTSNTITLPSLVNQFFGDGSDGNVTLSSGTTTLTRDMYYNNLTINGTATLKTNGYWILVAGTLDLTSAPANAITVAGSTGSTGGGGGTAGPVNGGATGTKSCTTTGSIGCPTGGGAGGTGNLGNGETGSASGGTGYFNGGIAGTASGAGGAGTVGTGGGNNGNTNRSFYPFRRPDLHLIMGATLYSGGSGGAGGGGGGGDSSTYYGGGGGGGGAGGGIIAISAYNINRGSSTAAGAINLSGGAGGTGGAGFANSGGGGGGAGGGGGWFQLIYGTLSGSSATNAIYLNGGAGGTGGNGGAAASGGSGGYSGYTGFADMVNFSTGTVSETSITAGSAGAPNSGAAGGAGAITNTMEINL